MNPSQSSEKVSHEQRLHTLEELAENDPYQAKQELDQLVLKEGDNSFSREGKEAVCRIEERCFYKLNREKHLGDVIRDAETFIRGVKNYDDDTYSQITARAKILTGWQLHFRIQFKNQLSNSYIKTIQHEYGNFGMFVDHLFRISERNKYREIEQELQKLFDSPFVVPHPARHRVRILVGIVAEKNYKMSHPHVIEINRANACSNCHEALAICEKLVEHPHWLSQRDLARLSYFRIDTAKALGKPELVAKYARDIPQWTENIELQEIKYHALIYCELYGEALNTINNVRKLPNLPHKHLYAAQKAELNIAMKKAALEWELKQKLPTHLQSKEPKSWDSHQKHMLILYGLSEPATQRGICELPESTVSYLITHMAELKPVRFVLGRLFESGNTRVYYNSRLIATRCNESDRNLTLWASGGQLQTHPEANLAKLFDGAPPKKLDILSTKNLCHDPKQGAVGCIQGVRDLLRWHPECQWDFLFIAADYKEMVTTGDGHEMEKQWHSKLNYGQENRKDQTQLPKNPSQIQLDVHELNLYPNMRYGCHYSEKYKGKRLDRKPHNIDPAVSRIQLADFLEQSKVRIQEKLESADSMQKSDKEKGLLRLTLIDHLERNCSINLSQVMGDRNTVKVQVLRQMDACPEDIERDMIEVIESFNSYLFEKQKTQVLGADQKKFEQLKNFVAERLQGNVQAYMLAAICRCHAEWLRQKWFSKPSVRTPSESLNENIIQYLTDAKSRAAEKATLTTQEPG